ncbi:MAG: hypothetical protein ABFS24_12895 [Pseudomonadota bacterium]
MKQLQKAGAIGLVVSSLLMLFSADVVAGGNKAMVEPIFTRYARIYQAPTLDFRTEFFKDKPMEEATDFDGYSLTLDFTWPINDRSQIQLFMPFYTSGEGVYDRPGEPFDGADVDIEGWGGVREFPSIIYERRFLWLEDKTGANVAWLAGIGRRLDTLLVEAGGDEIDRFNHSGYNWQLGFKMDGDIQQGSMTLLGNLRYVRFNDSDDINLTGDDVNFGVLYATGAVMFNDYGRFTPVLEAILEADFEDYTAFSLAPEVIYTLSDNFDVKFGFPFRLTSDGQKYAADLELTYRF